MIGTLLPCIKALKGSRLFPLEGAVVAVAVGVGVGVGLDAGLGVGELVGSTAYMLMDPVLSVPHIIPNGFAKPAV